MFIVDKLSVSVGEKQVLSDISFTLKPGELQVLMGPNGSGKSTLMHALMGHPRYSITQGAILFGGDDIAVELVEKRARRGIFLAFQHPYHIPGVKIGTFLHTAHAAITGQRLPLSEFNQLLSAALAAVGLPETVAERPLNDGFSGGERKRLELAQLLVLPVRVALLDELDSGLDADGISSIITALHVVRRERPELMILMVTHYARMIEELAPDRVHILSSGVVVDSGAQDKALFVAQQGYRDYAER